MPTAATSFLIAAALLIGVGLLYWILPVVFSVAGVVFSLVPIVLAAAGIYSCLVSRKPRNTKILWLIIIVLAPFFGPLLWFFWGKKHT